MRHLNSLVGLAVVLSVANAADAGAQARHPVSDAAAPIRVASVAGGSLEGLVSDERGLPVGGATVTAIGNTSTAAVTSRDGRYRIPSLPPGAYLVRAHSPGYAASRREFIEIKSSARTTLSLAIRRANDSTRVLAASLVGPVPSEPKIDPEPDATSASSGEDQSELAWRLRHLKRGVLKDTTERVALGEGDATPDPGGAGIGFAGRPASASQHFNSTILSELSLSGELNLLTAGSFDGPMGLLSGDALTRPLAYVSLTGLAGARSDWAVRGMLSQGEQGAWFVTGNYRTRAFEHQAYDVGISYSTQRYSPSRQQPRDMIDGSRAVGMLYGTGYWALTPLVSLDYGANYAVFDYLPGARTFSPRIGLTLAPAPRWRVRAAASRRALAPGAEEFLPISSGIWVPPERTFAPRAGQALRVEQTNHFEGAIERDLSNRWSLIVRGFYQQVDNQLSALFDAPPPVGTEPANYVVANVGDVNARGMSVGLSRMVGDHVRGSVSYEMAAAHWGPSPGAALWLLSAAPGRHHIQDLTTSVETDIPQTATHVFMLYRVNTAFARTDGTDGAGFDGRFDVQVTQALPFLDFTSTEWRVLIGVRNMFRDPGFGGSIYDELLVIRPPKRIVGGVLVRF